MAKPEPAQSKTYGLMGVMPHTAPRVGLDPDDMVMTFPNLLFPAFICFLAVIAGLTFISVFFDAPLEEMANPLVTPNPAKAPWYFLGLQELLHYMHPLLAGIVLPGVVVTALAVVPFIDKNPSNKFEDRKTALGLFGAFVIIAGLLIIIGVFFRGPQWHWTWPWIDGIY